MTRTDELLLEFSIWRISGRLDQAGTFTFFSFKYVMDDYKKITYTNFQLLYMFENFSSSNDRNRCGMRAFIYFFGIYTNNSMMKKKFETTLEPPYKRPPYSGSVDRVLGYGA